MEEIPGDYPFHEETSLEYLEEGMRAVEKNIEFGLTLMAVSLGRIKKDGLYLSIAPNFKAYLKLERTSLSYRNAVRLASIGERYWKFRPMLKQEGIQLSLNMSKVELLDGDVIDNDPMFWERFKSLSVKELAHYIRKRKSSSDVYTASNNAEHVSVTGASLKIDGQKLKGLNLNEARRNLKQGKRAVVLWVETDNEARKIRRVVKNIK